MAWTLTGNRDRGPRREHRPGVEQLDSRQLLSAGLGANPLRQAAAARLEIAQRPRAAAALVATPPLKAQALAQAQAAIQARAAALGGGESRLAARAPFAAQRAVQPASASVERPVGKIATGTPTEFDPIIGAALARQTYGVDGSGLTVAVIDTGVDYNKADLGGGFGPSARVIAGFNFANGSGDPMATSSSHGTAVASLIAGADPNHLGVAPGVDIVALKVTGDNNAADLSQVADALQWVVDHHAEYKISVVNMSLSDGKNYARNWDAYDAGIGQRVTELVQRLKALNIPVVAASGNSFKGRQGQGFVATIDGVISVTATKPNDSLLPNAQRLGVEFGRESATKIAAPGSGLMALNGGGYSAVEGTSFAAPLVSGSVVLLQQIYMAKHGQLPTVEQVTGWLQNGATPIRDAATGISLGRLDLLKSASLVPGAAPAQTPPPTNPEPTPPVVVTPPPTTPEPTPPVVVTPPPGSQILIPPTTPPVSQNPPPTPTPDPTPTPTPTPEPEPTPEPTPTPTPEPTPTPTPEPTPTPTPDPDPITVPVAPSAPSYVAPLYLNGKPVRGADQAASNSTLARAEAGQLLRAMARWAKSSNGLKTVSPVRAWTPASK